MKTVRRVLPILLAFVVFGACASGRRGLNLDFERSSREMPRRPAGFAVNVGMEERVYLDREIVHSGTRSLRLTPPGGDPSVRLTVGVPPKLAAGRRVRLSGWIRTEGLSGRYDYAGFIVGARPREGRVAVDSMPGRGPVGTTDWTRFETESYIDGTAVEVFVGVYARGGGTAWFDGLALEIDGRRVAALGTDRPAAKYTPQAAAPVAPRRSRGESKESSR